MGAICSTSLMFATLFTGFFWEMKNYYSLPKWVYHVPYVGFWKVFEMPILGYLGYLLFGLIVFTWTSMVFAGLFNRISGQSLSALRLRPTDRKSVEMAMRITAVIGRFYQFGDFERRRLEAGAVAASAGLRYQGLVSVRRWSCRHRRAVCAARAGAVCWPRCRGESLPGAGVLVDRLVGWVAIQVKADGMVEDGAAIGGA